MPTYSYYTSDYYFPRRLLVDAKITLSSVDGSINSLSFEDSSDDQAEVRLSLLLTKLILDIANEEECREAINHKVELCDMFLGYYSEEESLRTLNMLGRAITEVPPYTQNKLQAVFEHRRHEGRDLAFILLTGGFGMLKPANSTKKIRDTYTRIFHGVADTILTQIELGRELESSKEYQFALYNKPLFLEKFLAKYKGLYDEKRHLEKALTSDELLFKFFSTHRDQQEPDSQKKTHSIEAIEKRLKQVERALPSTSGASFLTFPVVELSDRNQNPPPAGSRM